MSHSDFPAHATDRTLFDEYGVQVKKSCQNGIPRGDRPGGFHPNDNVTKEKTKADMLGESDKPVVCRSGFCRSEQRRSQYLAASIACLAVLSMILFGYVVHIDNKHSAQVADLRQELNQLAHLCGASQSSGNSDSDVVAGSVADTGDSDRRPLRFAYAGTPPEGDDSEEPGMPLSSWNLNQMGRSRADDDGEDESDHDDDPVEVIGDEAGGHVRNQDTAVDQLFGRVRRSPDKKPVKENKKRHNGKGRKRKGGICKKYKRCKEAKDRSGQVKKGCVEILACVQSAQNKTKMCRRVRACIEKESTLKTSAAIQTPPPLPFIPKAVHFFSDFWSDRRQQDFGREAPLKFLKGADWMTKMYKDKSEQPIQQTRDGGFHVNQTGLYLIYSSVCVMFHDLKPRQSMAVVVNGQRLFKCMDSVDYLDPEMSPEKNLAKYKTCAMTGVTHLASGDRLEVQNLYDNAEIDLSTDATYFGAILFSPGAVKV